MSAKLDVCDEVFRRFGIVALRKCAMEIAKDFKMNKFLKYFLNDPFLQLTEISGKEMFKSVQVK